MPLYGLTDDDKALIESMIRREVTRRINTPIRDEMPGHSFAPDVYIALPPSGGIPALTRAAGTSAGDGDKPGSAICNIYRIDYTVDPEVLEPVDGLDATVFNLSTTAVDEDWIEVKRTKFGIWLAATSSSSSLEIREGVLGQNLVAATHGIDTPATAPLHVWEKTSGGTWSRNSSKDVTVTTRMTQHSTLLAGTWVVVAEHNFEWRPIAADCGITDLFAGTSDTGTGTA